MCIFKKVCFHENINNVKSNFKSQTPKYAWNITIEHALSHTYAHFTQYVQ